MKNSLTVAFCNLLLLAASFAIDANAQATAAQAHVVAAKAAVAPKAGNGQPWHVYQSLFNELCTENRSIDAMAANVAQGKWEGRGDWYYAPHKFFDNLYFIGTKTAGMYVINTSAGMIMIDTNFDWNVEENILGLLQFGLDPANIKYVIVTAGRPERYWGAKTIQNKYPNAHVMMSEADWAIVAKDNSPASLKPKKDMVATDGQKLTLGNTTVTIYVTPGDTPGTLSLIFPAVETTLQMTYEKPKRGPHNHMVALWGGTDFSVGRQGVTYWTDAQTLFKTYLASLARFKGLADAAGVDTILSPSMSQQSGVAKLADARILEQDSTPQTNQLVARVEKGEIITHPFISKDDVERYFTIERECAQAQLAWRTGS